MKVAFDEHVPAAIARALESFANEQKFKSLTGGLQVERAQDYAPKPSDLDYLENKDAPWIKRYSKSGGQIIISGDTNMMTQPHERLALLEEGMIVVFFGKKWSSWQFFRKCALILCWWPKIVTTVKKAERGTFWRVTTDFGETGDL